jgi:hypothetical protein
MDAKGKSQVKVFYNVTATVRENGKVVQVSKGRNSIVTTGLQLLRDLLGGTGSRPDEMQVGTGTTATTTSMTALVSSVLTKTISRRIQKTYGVELQALVGTTEANGYTLSEVGCFQQDTMVGRAIISPTIEKTVAKEVTLSHVITFEAA